MKSLLQVFALICISSTAYAQDGSSYGRLEDRRYQNKIEVSRVMPVAGVVISDFQGNQSGQFTSQNGLQAGLLMDFGRRNGVIETGVLYRQLGATVSSTQGSTNVNLRYLSIPVSAKYYFDAYASTTTYIKAGLVPSVLVASNIDYPVDRLDVPDINARPFELSGVLGVGGKFMISPSFDLFVEADYIRGLTAIAAATDLVNSSFSLNTGIGINL
ncbi:MAG: outer membrane beta-barrel protein [Oligoflexia bacterium]|nr:outer membrane beta-barrel protein [Oligoflexia bacterium]